MKLDDIDLERGLIYMANSKTMTGHRILPIHPNFKNLIEKLCMDITSVVSSLTLSVHISQVIT